MQCRVQWSTKYRTVYSIVKYRVHFSIQYSEVQSPVQYSRVHSSVIMSPQCTWAPCNGPGEDFQHHLGSSRYATNLQSSGFPNSLLCLLLCPVRALLQENLELFQISDETHNHKKGRYYTLVNHCKTWLSTYSNYMPKKVKSELFCWTLNSTGPDRRKKLIHFVSYMVIGGSVGLLWQHDLSVREPGIIYFL